MYIAAFGRIKGSYNRKQFKVDVEVDYLGIFFLDSENSYCRL